MIGPRTRIHRPTESPREKTCLPRDTSMGLLRLHLHYSGKSRTLALAIGIWHSFERYSGRAMFHWHSRRVLEDIFEAGACSRKVSWNCSLPIRVQRTRCLRSCTILERTAR